MVQHRLGEPTLHWGSVMGLTEKERWMCVLKINWMNQEIFFFFNKNGAWIENATMFHKSTYFVVVWNVLTTVKKLWRADTTLVETGPLALYLERWPSFFLRRELITMKAAPSGHPVIQQLALNSFRGIRSPNYTSQKVTCTRVSTVPESARTGL